ncbi:MAG: bile acid:sodium symporter [Planctomycetaceae bacterium]|nr:bile acid:sodium symporter [Planctomycetaceae bacterium]
MLTFLQKRWFLVALVVLIPWGMWIGFHASPERVSTFPKHLVTIASGVLTATVLFLMSVTLDSQKLLHSFRSPGPVLWATVVNSVVVPLTAMGLVLIQLSEDFAVGLMVAASVPSTMAAASVWTRKANGNDAVSLLGTIVTNSTCFLVTPFWLGFGLNSSVEINVVELIWKLTITALLPITLGQLARILPWARTRADQRKTGFGVAAQMCILALIFWAAVQGGVKLQGAGSGSYSGLPALVVWGSCMALHLWGMLVAIAGAKVLKIRADDAVAVAFSASQKTLPIGVFIASGLAANGYPFAVFPILMFHASQLILDTLFVEPFQKWVEKEQAVVTDKLATDLSPLTPE